MKEIKNKLDAEEKEEEPPKVLHNYSFPFPYWTKNTDMVEEGSHYYTCTTYNMTIVRTSLR